MIEILTIETTGPGRSQLPGPRRTGRASYAMLDAAGDTIAVFSGGSLLFGATGRADLL